MRVTLVPVAAIGREGARRHAGHAQHAVPFEGDELLAADGGDRFDDMSVSDTVSSETRRVPGLVRVERVQHAQADAGFDDRARCFRMEHFRTGVCQF